MGAGSILLKLARSLLPQPRHDRLHADPLGIDPAHARRYPRGRRGRLVPFRPRALVVSCLERAPRALRQAQTTGICSRSACGKGRIWP